MNVKDALEDLVSMSIDSYNLILKGSFPGSMSDDVANHLKLCLQVIDRCTVKPTEEEKHMRTPHE